MEVVFRMINIPIPEDEERRRAIFGDAVIDENVRTFSRTFRIYASNIDLSSRRAFLVNPQEIEILIDYNTMRAPLGLDARFHRGVAYSFSEPHGENLQDYQDTTRTETWIDYDPETFGMNPERGDPIDLNTSADGRRLHHSELNQFGNPLYGLIAQMRWNRNRRDYADNFMRRPRLDRIPYHEPMFHLNGPYEHGVHVPPLEIRRPPDEDLPFTGLQVRRDIDHEADVAGIGVVPDNPRVIARREPTVEPRVEPPIGEVNPLDIQNRDRILRDQFEDWIREIENRITRDPENRNFTFDFEVDRVWNENHIRRARQGRYEARIQAEQNQVPQQQEEDQDMDDI